MVVLVLKSSPGRLRPDRACQSGVEDNLNFQQRIGRRFVRVLRRTVVTAGCIKRPLARYAIRWTRQGFLLPRTEYERRSLKRLVNMVESFRARGLCAEPAYSRLPAMNSFSELAELPVLTRAGAQDLFERLRILYSRRRYVYALGTGGWSGEPVHYFRDRSVDDYSYGMLIEMQGIMGWRPEMACYCLWGDPRELGINYAPGTGLRRIARMVQRYGCYAPREKELTEFLDAVRADPGCAVYGFPNLLLQCAQFMRQHNIVLEPGVVAAAWGTAEALHPHLPALFAEAFNAPLRDFYGSREVASISAECEYGRRHLNPRCIVEAIDAGTQQLLPAGQAGHLLVTDLFNAVTPLIRYQIGDMGSVEWCECECGRSGFFLRELIGRPPDVIELASGARFTPHFFSTMTLSYPAIQRFQVVRHAVADFEFRYVGRALSPEEHARFLELIVSKTEGAHCRIVRVAELEKAASGKARWYIDLSEAGQSPPSGK